MAILRVVGDSLCQWDTGRKVLISVPANTDIKRVDFKSCAVDEAMGMRVFVEEGRLVAEIPNIMLQYAEEITAYVVMRHSGDNERTILINTFEVEPKDKPPGYVCDQQEILRFETLEKRIEELEKGGLKEEKDPTVPEWAKQPQKPTYTADEVGAASKEDIRKLFEEKAEKDAIPTKTSQLTNDSDFQTGEQVRAEIEKMTHFTFKKVDSLTEAVKQNVIYLIPNKERKEDNIFDEYLLIDGVPELIGSTAIDLSGYALKTEIPTVPETLPNPNPLTFTGAVTGSYDGSTPLSVEIPTGGSGGSQVSEAVKIAEFTIDLEMSTAKIFEVTATEYPEIKNYNTLWFALDNATNGNSPWIKVFANNKELIKTMAAPYNGHRAVIRFKNNHAYAILSTINPSMIPTSPYTSDGNINISCISEAWVEIGELESIAFKSYTTFMQENAKIYLYGWNE